MKRWWLALIGGVALICSGNGMLRADSDRKGSQPDQMETMPADPPGPEGVPFGKVFRHDEQQPEGSPGHLKQPDRAARARRGTNGISYHGGPLILNTTNVYYIWYGDWSNNSAVSILTNLAGSIGGSPYFNINTTYYNGGGTHVTNAVSYAGSATDNYSLGTTLTDSGVRTVVSNAIAGGAVPKDTNAAYFVLTSADVDAPTNVRGPLAHDRPHQTGRVTT